MSNNKQQPAKGPSRKRKIEWEAPTEEQRKKWHEEWQIMKAEIEERMKHYDPVVEDRTEIEKQLQSGASVLVLEVPKSTRSQCKARFCLLAELEGSKNIESCFRFNLKDSTGQRTGERNYWKRKSFLHYCLMHCTWKITY
jgi:hypothetical protein